MSSFQTFLLIVTLCVSWESAIAAKVCSVENEEWACKSGGCIATENLCDGIPHCRDGSDETKASCKEMQCSFLTSFRCDYGACILLDFVCDHIYDCVDKSDEDSDMCRKRRNDLLNEEIKRESCIVGGQMECWSGQCISITDKCNGVEDCEDGSDELLSLCQTILCNQHQFQCDYGACLPMKAKCNGTKECWDGSDEYEGLCKKEIATILTPTTRRKSNAVTSSITDPTIEIKPKISTQHVNTRKIITTIFDDSTDFEAIENYEKDLTTTPEFEISLIGPSTTTKTNVIMNYSEKNMQITAPKIRETTTTTVDVSKQTDSGDTNDQEVKGILDKSKAEGNKEDFENRLNSMPSDRIEFITTSTNENETMVVQNTSLPAATSAENFGLHQIFKKYPVLNTKEIVAKKYSKNDLEITTPKIRDTIKIKKINKNQTFPIDARNSTPSKQLKDNEYKGQEVRKFHALFVTTQTPNLKTNLSSSPNNSIESNLSVQSLINSRPQTDVLSTSSMTHIHETLNSTEKSRNVNYPGEKSYCDASILDDCAFPFKCWRFIATNRYGRIYKGNVQQLSERETLLISCSNQYNLSGKNKLTCTGGKWDGTMPKCIEIAPSCRADLLPKCVNPMRCTIYYTGISKGRINKYGSNSRTYPLRTTIVFGCASGHKLNGAKTATCSNHGWKYSDGFHSSECQRISNTCDKGILHNCIYPLICETFDTEVGDLKKIQSVTSQKSISDAEQIHFSCEYGYVLDGENALTCMGGKWDHSMPKCIEHSCRADLLPECKYPLICTRYDTKLKSGQIIIDNSIIESTNYALSTQIVFRCAQAFKLIGEEQTICGSTGWSHIQNLIQPQCISL